MTGDLSLTETLKRGSVGSDVAEVQTRLRLAGYRVPTSSDGKYDADTEQAVRRFQADHTLTVDGKVGQTTWRALERAAYAWEAKTAGAGAGATAPTAPDPYWAKFAPAAPTAPRVAAAPAAEGDFCFPIAHHPVDWRGGYRYFGAQRPGGRKHAGCDLYTELGNHVYAIADGVLVRDPYDFYLGTEAIEIRHGSLLVRYGEVLAGSCQLRGGSPVTRGQVIAKVGKCQGITQPMLHFEVYTKGSDASALTLRGSPPYMRRGDVTDPASYLDKWVEHVPSG